MTDAVVKQTDQPDHNRSTDQLLAEREEAELQFWIRAGKFVAGGTLVAMVALLVLIEVYGSGLTGWRVTAALIGGFVLGNLLVTLTTPSRQS